MEIESPRGIRLLDEHALKTIQETYTRLTSFKGFPENYCDLASGEVEKLGFKAVKGFFLLDKPIKGRSSIADYHAWCVDREKTIIDLTLAQWNEGLLKPVTEGVLIVRNGDPLYGKYNQFAGRNRNGAIRLSVHSA